MEIPTKGIKWSSLSGEVQTMLDIVSYQSYSVVMNIEAKSAVKLLKQFEKQYFRLYLYHNIEKN